jgi:hypothetical protein
VLAILTRLSVFLALLAATAATAVACGGGGGALATSLKTSLSGGGKEGEEITVVEGSGVKDTATLSGENAGKAGGAVSYAVYSDKECKTLVSKAGEGTVKEGKVPASEEKKLEAGSVYYWQAVYTGDANNAASTSTCGKEVLTVKASTSLKTSLSGGGKEGEEITVAEGSGVKDTATLSGTKSSTAGGTISYAVYSDKECKTLVSKAGEGTVKEGKAPASEEKKPEGAAVYYWKAEYSGDPLHESSNTCGKEVLTVKAATTLATTLAGGGKEGEKITVAAGSKVKDQATLGGTKSATATGTVEYVVYSDSKCEKLVTKAGGGSVEGGKAPPSEEKELEAGATYYWKVEYSGDPLHESVSACGKEVLGVMASTSLKTSLSGGGKESEEITVVEGSGVKDTATLSGTNAVNAAGTVEYAFYSDKKCENLVASAGKGAVEGGKAGGSEEKKPEGAAVYYWKAEYGGDSVHEPSSSVCGKEVLTVKAAMTLTTTLAGEEDEAEEEKEIEEKEEAEVIVGEDAAVADLATLSGTGSSGATGVVKYAVYSDPECKELVAEAGETEIEEGEISPSEDVTLEEGTYYWQAEYSGDALHEQATSSCGTEIAHVIAATSVSVLLSGEGEKAEDLGVDEGAGVSAAASIAGSHAAEATGTIKYTVYGDPGCDEPIASAGEATLEGESPPLSSEEKLEPGLYFWRAEYSGDSLNDGSRSPCGAAIELVEPPLGTTLSGEGWSAPEIEVLEGTAVRDEATLHGEHASEATGTVKYAVYSDEECKESVTEAGEVAVEGENAPASSKEVLEPGTYYWQAEYSGDESNPASISPCGTEVLVVTTPASIGMSLSGGGKEGKEITVANGAAATAQATLSGTNASAANGYVEYMAYTDAECTELAAVRDADSTAGSVPSSGEVILPEGTYYWQVTYSGDGVNHGVIGACGAAVETVSPPPITLSLSSSEQSGETIEVDEETSVIAEAVLHGEHASEATGTVKYAVYSDEECKELVAKAGEVTVAGEHAPSSSKQVLKEGLYYWRAEYSGDAKNSAATSACGPVQERNMNNPPGIYAALGDSYSSGEGARFMGGFFYSRTDVRRVRRVRGRNLCHRSPFAWPALTAMQRFGNVAVANEAEVAKRNPSQFIFRACSGDETHNIFLAGQYDEFFMGPGAGVSGTLTTPAQSTWLRTPGGVAAPNGAANNRIDLVTMSIGGNDATFGGIARACIEWPSIHAYSPAPCQAAITAGRARFGAMQAGIQAALQSIHAAAPRSIIVVPAYPQPLNPFSQEILIGWLPFFGGKIPIAHIDNSVPGAGGLTAARSVEQFVSQLNNAVRQAVVGSGVPNAGFFPATEGAFTPGGIGVPGHRFGDGNPLWINPIVWLHFEESVHPTPCGHRAIARVIAPVLRVAPVALCP